MAGSSRMKSAINATVLVALIFARTDGISMLVVLLAWQVRHQLAVKSTKTACPSARAFSTAATLHGCQLIASGLALLFPAKLPSAGGARQLNCFSKQNA